MKLSHFLGNRGAEFQFGRMVYGWFHFLWFVPIYFKLFDLNWWQSGIIIIAFILLIWSVGFLAYRFGVVKNFRKKEFKGLL